MKQAIDRSAPASRVLDVPCPCEFLPGVEWRRRGHPLHLRLPAPCVCRTRRVEPGRGVETAKRGGLMHAVPGEYCSPGFSSRVAVRSLRHWQTLGVAPAFLDSESTHGYWHGARKSLVARSRIFGMLGALALTACGNPPPPAASAGTTAVPVTVVTLQAQPVTLTRVRKLRACDILGEAATTFSPRHYAMRSIVVTEPSSTGPSQFQDLRGLVFPY